MVVGGVGFCRFGLCFGLFFGFRAILLRIWVVGGTYFLPLVCWFGCVWLWVYVGLLTKEFTCQKPLLMGNLEIWSMAVQPCRAAWQRFCCSHRDLSSSMYRKVFVGFWVGFVCMWGGGWLFLGHCWVRLVLHLHLQRVSPHYPAKANIKPRASPQKSLPYVKQPKPKLPLHRFC